MLNRSARLAMSTSVLKALPGKLDIKRHSPIILYLPNVIIYFHASDSNRFNAQMFAKHRRDASLDRHLSLDMQISRPRYANLRTAAISNKSTSQILCHIFPQDLSRWCASGQK